jgi:sugar phosphate isomerase/epimerase
MHERVSFNNLCFMEAPLGEDVVTWKTLGARRIGVLSLKLDPVGWDKGIAVIRDTGLKVATLMHPFMMGSQLDQRDRWDFARAQLMRTLDAAECLGAETVYMTTGARGALGWEDAAQAFKEAVAPCAAAAAARDIPLLIETSTPAFADIHIVHTLRDTVALAKMAGLGICIDIYACWTEAGFYETLRDALPLTRLVQVSDYSGGDRWRFGRAVPGDGIVPLSNILTAILDGGYRGAFDLELIGRRISEEGPIPATKRAAEWLSRFLRDYENTH